MNRLAEIAWWCSGTLGQPWRWEYRPLVGVWLLVAGLGLAYVRSLRRHAAEAGGEPAPATRHYARRFGAGLALLIVSSDWPLGPLGAGYLASVAALRTLLLTFGVAPLLLLGTPPWMLRRLLRIGSRADGRPGAVFTLVRLVTLPWVAFLVFNCMLVVTQLPPVVDTLKVTQLGSFVLDIAWLAASIIMWVPLLRPLPELGGLGDPMRLLYLFGLSILPTVPASFLTFSRFPLYRLYELAPRVVPSLDAVVDQQIAGLGLKIVGGIILWSVMTVLFFRWAAREQPGAVPTVSWSQFERDLERYDLRHRREQPPSP
ncbi:MAG: cytochrome c oxidase assembly protein [Actinobacteria bacterium]|nr:cytochrome c oxidase assembly protein [Actinomycetota bacterium]